MKLTQDIKLTDLYKAVLDERSASEDHTPILPRAYDRRCSLRSQDAFKMPTVAESRRELGNALRKMKGGKN